jgi:actin-related protein
MSAAAGLELFQQAMGEAPADTKAEEEPVSDSDTDSDDDGPLPVVLELGTHTIKAGFADDDAPRTKFPTVVSVAHAPARAAGLVVRKDILVGDAACDWTRPGWSVTTPISRGVVQDFDAMEKIWHHTFYNELRIEPRDHPILIIDAPLSPRACREKITQIMFETYNVPKLYVNIAHVLALYASGRTTGAVLDCGHGSSSSGCVYEGYILPHTIQECEVGGASTF